MTILSELAAEGGMKHYNLYVDIFVGYRHKSIQASASLASAS